jgi:predicted permease
MFIVMVAATLLLRHRGVLGGSSKPLLSAILMDVVCPAVIFSSLASSHPSAQHLHAAGVVFGAEIINAGIAFLIARYILRLHRNAIGVFVIAATFGSTALIGTAMVQVLFHNDPEITSMGLIIGQFGVGIPVNTLGILLAIHFGSRDSQVPISQHLKQTLKTPFMLALYAGIGWSFFGLPTSGSGLETLFGACRMIGASQPFCTAMVIGLSLERFDFRSDLATIVAAAVVCLAIEPLLVSSITHVMTLDIQTRVVANLFAAMPASPLVVVFALKYGGDVVLASKLSMATLLLSTATLPLFALIA